MSTVLDVTVCLLLVGAAVATLALGVPTTDTEDPSDAARVVSLLGTVTASVPGGPDRRAHDTLAGHLGTATVSGAKIGARRIDSSPYPASVRKKTAALVDARTFVTTRWRPYPDAELGGGLAVGVEPPRTADVTTTTVVVDSGIEHPRRTGSFESLARALAIRYVRWLFPPERTRAALVDPRTAPRTAGRYRRVASTFDSTLAGPLRDSDARRANEVLAEAVAGRFESAIRDRYETPRAAATNVTIDEVRVTVRRWSP